LRSIRTSLCLLLLVSFFVAPLRAQIKEKDLPKTYRHWLQEEVNYIIETKEKVEFLKLKSDDERDAFIRNFWEARNPSPGSETNSYKEEHYQRLAYANEHFGNLEAHDGWATDQGQVYITLGPPKQKTPYINSRNIRPIEIWFYQSPSLALPPYFSVTFYKRGPGDPFTIYSPYQDGPNRLVTGLETLNDQNRSLKQLRQSIGDGASRSALTMLPSEPVDLEHYAPSMISDSILATIRSLADNPFETAKVDGNRHREKVTASIYTVENTPEPGYTVVRDVKGQPTVSLLLRLQHADAGIVGDRKSGGPGYDITLRSTITTESGKAVYDTVSSYSAALSAPALATAKNKVFAAEDQFPLEPGKYVIQSTLTNNINLEAHRITTKVTVPTPTKTLGISTPAAYTGNPVQVSGAAPPFTYAGVRFSPLGAGNAYVHTGDALRCVFQLWLPKAADGKFNDQPIAMHYYFGSVVSGGQPMDEADETLTPDNIDAGGSFVTGHSFNLSSAQPGNYRVIVRATQGSGPAVFGVLTLRILPNEIPTAGWSAYAPPEPQQDLLKRALSADAQGDTQAAISFLQSDLATNSSSLSTLSRLATLLAEQRRVVELADLADKPAMHNAVDAATLTAVALALANTGREEKAIEMLNAQSKLQPLSSSLYRQLAMLDDKVGRKSDGDAARKLAADHGAQ
jgi:GWxTD domain-containing protein